MLPWKFLSSLVTLGDTVAAMLLGLGNHAAVGFEPPFVDHPRDLRDLAAGDVSQPAPEAAHKTQRVNAVADHQFARASPLRPRQYISLPDNPDMTGMGRLLRQIREPIDRTDCEYDTTIPAFHSPRYPEQAALRISFFSPPGVRTGAEVGLIESGADRHSLTSLGESAENARLNLPHRANSCINPKPVRA